MRKGILFLLIIFINYSCFDDSGSHSSGSTGTLKITVKTASTIWGYPQGDGSGNNLAYNGDTTGDWLYPETGGDGVPADEESLWNTDILSADIGDRINVVYLYSELGEKSDSTPVLYKGTSDSNNSVIRIPDIEEGSYYVVAFYDYKTGGVQTNILNRYDRYAAYTESDSLDGTLNSTPYADKATKVEIKDGDTAEVTIEIRRDWLLGRPKTSDGGTGRIFLTSGDLVPTPDGTH